MNRLVDVTPTLWDRLDRAGRADGTFDVAVAVAVIEEVARPVFEAGDRPVLYGLELEEPGHTEAIAALYEAIAAFHEALRRDAM